ncbi:NAD(P)-dependent oxidoreductase [Patescibacteria group bacterium]|nr:NAD(P)-dependent oxidoreductase [Patescibacteria group bacterium]
MGSPSFDFEKVITFGASGTIGSYVDFGMRPTHAECDITDEHAVEELVARVKPTAIILLAGATDMTRAEAEPAYAYELNVRGTYNVARAARSHGVALVYASSSRVFKGDKPEPYTEDDVPEPETHYGHTKHIGEIITATLVEKHIIARTSWVFGGSIENDTKFYGKVFQQLQSGQPEIVGLNDVHGSPTFGKDYIAALKTLMSEGRFGTFHVANAGVATRYDLAQAMVELMKSHTSVRAVDRTYFPTGATLPVNESITSKYLALRSWKEALAEYLSG